MNTSKVGFIGCGNIATAIIGGMVSSGYIKSDNITVFDTDFAKSQALKTTFGVKLSDSSADVVTSAKYVFLTVKPQIYDIVLNEIKSFVSTDTCIVDVGAGVSIGFVKSAVEFDCKVVRVMPNTPLLIGEGASALVKCAPVTDDEFNFVFGAFASSGVAKVVDESLIDAVTGISGSSPAFAFRFAKNIIDCGVKNGIDEATATALVAQTLIGSANMILKSGKTPGELIKMVSSPNGTTVAGLAKLDEMGFDACVDGAVDAAVKRSSELGK